MPELGWRHSTGEDPGGEISVLHVDDEPSFTDLVATYVERIDQQFAVETAESVDAGLDRLSESTFDCVVSDYDMDDRTGIEFLREVRRRYPQLPFILFTGKGSEELASEAISSGVTDYLQKATGTSQYTVLVNRIRNAVERRRAQQRLADQERHLRTFFDHSPFGIIEWTEAFEFARVNDAAAEILGYDATALVGKSWTEIVPEEDRSDLRASLSALGSGQTDFQHVNQNVRADGERVVCEWYNHAVTDDDGEIIALYSQFHDITERERQNRRLETLIENLPGMVYRCRYEEGWPMEHVAGEAEAITGYTPAELEADERRYGEQLTHPEDQARAREVVDEALADGTEFELTYRLVTADDETKWVWERGQGIYEDGELVALEGFITDITEQRTAVEELREQREFTTQLLNALNDVFYMLDEEGRFERWNDRLTAVTGYGDDDIEGMDALQFFPQYEREQVMEAITEVLVTGEATIAADLRTADGTVPYEFTGARLTDSQGDLRGLVGIGRDVSEHVERERTLEETNTLLRSLVETLPVGVLAEDGKGRVTAVNEEMLDLFGLEMPLEAVRGSEGKRLRTALRDTLDDPEAFIERIEEITANRESVTDETLRLPDGRVINRAYRPLDLPGGEGHLWVFQDVSEVVDTERKLTALHDIADDLTTSDSIETVCELLIDASEEILDFDLSVIDLYRDGRLEKAAVSANIPPEGSRTMSVDEGLVGKTFRTGESFLIDDVQTMAEADPQGPYRAAISVPIGDHGVFQAVAHEAGVFDERDLELAELLADHAENAFTRIKRERDLKQRNERLDDLARIVSHDLRNPLNVAQGRIELARETADSEHLAPAADAIDRSLELVDDLLALASQDEQVREPEPVSLAAVARDSWAVVETEDATLSVETERTVLADRSRLRQLFENLFRNSVEHGSTSSRSESDDSVEHGSTSSQPGADDSVEHGSTGESDDGEPLTITVGDCPGGFYVADDGPGIPEELREEVFKPGYTGSSDGTGFGLSIVEQVATAHGWEVTINEESSGARFDITGVSTVQPAE